MQVDKDFFLRTQMNKIFEVIQTAKLDPGDFEWKKIDSPIYKDTKVPTIFHRPTNFFFVMHTKDNKQFTLSFSPGEKEWIGSSWASDFDQMLEALIFWLACVKREFEAPDLWSAIYEEGKFAETASAVEGSNDPFSSEEQKYIAIQLHEIEEYLKKTHSLQGEQLEFVKKRLSYLEEAAKRQGRQDWIHTTIGVFFTIAFSLGLPGEAVRELFRFAASVLSRIIGTVLSLPIP